MEMRSRCIFPEQRKDSAAFPHEGRSAATMTVHQEDPTAPRQPPAEDMRLLGQLRCQDAEAGRRFVRDYYPGVYRYLFYLTGRREAAEDLAQQTFVQAWRSLETFEGRSQLRTWLHRIAHREFLQSLRSQRPQLSLEEV